MHINQPEHRHHPKFVVRAFPPLASLEAGPLNPTARAIPGARGPQVRHGVTGASLVRAQEGVAPAEAWKAARPVIQASIVEQCR